MPDNLPQGHFIQNVVALLLQHGDNDIHNRLIGYGAVLCFLLGSHLLYRGPKHLLEPGFYIHIPVAGLQILQGRTDLVHLRLKITLVVLGSL